MKLIGATDFFVRVPFVIEGILLGVIGAAIPMGIIYVVYEKAVAYIISRFGVLGNLLQFLNVWDVFRYLLPIGIGLGVGIGFFGSMVLFEKTPESVKNTGFQKGRVLQRQCSLLPCTKWKIIL